MVLVRSKSLAALIELVSSIEKTDSLQVDSDGILDRYGLSPEDLDDRARGLLNRSLISAREAETGALLDAENDLGLGSSHGIMTTDVKTSRIRSYPKVNTRRVVLAMI